ncbi:hypothetical protein BBP40_001069 [Aspergillus hancockii]|nr:hypothetical protein BBP40_001069 [Aspergillus hancockii]
MEGGQSTDSQRGFILGAATKNDLDDITGIHIKGFQEEPQVQYCYPLRHQYLGDHWKWARKEYKGFLEQPQKYLAHVLDAPVEWSGSNQTYPKEKERKDANKKHREAYRAAVKWRFKTYFTKWSNEQINLSSLAVHPDFRRRGGGTMLVNWGITAAEKKGPMGHLLYKHLGFEKIADEDIQVNGEEETLTSTVVMHGAGEQS